MDPLPAVSVMLAADVTDADAGSGSTAGRGATAFAPARARPSADD